MTHQLRRIQWLLPPERDAYRTVPRALEREGPCLRCGEHVGYPGHGMRRMVVAVSRVRGSQSRAREWHAIHRGCIPTPEMTHVGLPARRRK